MIRDERTKALLNDDIASLNKYKIERDRVRRMEQLSKEMIEIKKVLSSVCERLEKIESL